MRHRKHHRHSKKHRERQSGSDSSRSRHRIEKEKGAKRNVGSDANFQHKVSDEERTEGSHHKRKERSY